MSTFTHLHLQTEYSLMEGAIRIKDLIKQLKELNYQACAITDRGNMFGVVEFEHAMRKAELTPVVGLGAYVAKGSRFNKEHEPNTFHAYQTVLLCQNRQGYQNLTYLASQAYTEGKYRGLPRIDHELLEERHEGLIALSGGLDGELAYRILKGQYDEALTIAKWYQELFAGRYYIELQATGHEEQVSLNQQLIQIGSQLNIPLVATNNCHYLKQEEAEAHYILELMRMQRRVTDSNNPPQKPSQLYLKSQEEMQEAFADLPPEALTNTQLIVDQCDLSLSNDTYFLPKFEIPEEYTLESWLEHEAKEGLNSHLQHLYAYYKPSESFEEFRKPYDERLKYELGIINKMEFPGYFLIVADFVNWAKNNECPVGPGRGSGAGSLVAYSIRITDVDPLRYGLLFERFLNPDRISMPDFDIDFEVTGRERVIQYVKERYGETNVCQIATFQTLGAKAVIRNVARVLDFPYSEADKIAKLIPNTLGISLGEAIEQEPELAAVEKDEEGNGSRLISIARTLEGLSTHLGTHAAGVIIMDGDIRRVMPVCTSKDGSLQSMFTMKYAEDQGAVKFDFLGLLNLSTIDAAIKLIAPEFPPDAPFDINNIPIDDSLTFELLCRGDTTGVFQLESSGMKKLLVDMRPSCFEDIVAILALYRPGPLGSGMVDDFIQCKHGRKQVVYPHPLLESILKETYGVMVYQEQIMQAVQVLAGFTLGQADLLRRAIGKKIAEILVEQRLKFVEGCCSNPAFVEGCKAGVEPEKTANDIFDLIDYFSGYGFNKSHTVAYGIITYQTAYLKAHYPVQFMAALLNGSMNNPDKIVNFISECRDMDIPVLPPDVNYSHNEFTVSTLGYAINKENYQKLRYHGFTPEQLRPLQQLDGKEYQGSEDFLAALEQVPSSEHLLAESSRITKDCRLQAVRFGLNAVKNVGGQAVDAIIEVREAHEQKRLDDLMDFMKNIDHGRVNKRIMETLVQCGAFDSMHDNRAQLFEVVEEAIHLGQEFQRGDDPNQTSLFELMDQSDAQQTESQVQFPNIKDWPTKQRLGLEREALGFYVSGHPLDRYASEVEKFATTMDLLENKYNDRDTVTLAGLVVAKTVRLNKRSERFAIIKIEDLRGSLELPVYAKTYAEAAEVLESTDPIMIKGRVNYRDDEVGLIPDEITLLEQHREANAKALNIELASSLDAQQSQRLRGILQKSSGECAVRFHVITPEKSHVWINTPIKITPSPKIIEEIDELLKHPKLRFAY